jgi:calcium/proton exchanger cax
LAGIFEHDAGLQHGRAGWVALETIYFQLNSHAHLLNDCNAIETDEIHELDPWAASIVLIVATVGVTACSDYLVDSIDGIVKASHMSRAFIGLIIALL